MPMHARLQTAPGFRQIAPILLEKCAACHNHTTRKGELNLESYDALMHGFNGRARVEFDDPIRVRIRFNEESLADALMIGVVALHECLAGEVVGVDLEGHQAEGAQAGRLRDGHVIGCHDGGAGDVAAGADAEVREARLNLGADDIEQLFISSLPDEIASAIRGSAIANCSA